MSTMVKRDMPTLRALKQEGHDIIDDLVKKGWSKSTVYRMLAERLGVAESGAHFYNIYTIRDATKAVNALKAMRKELIEERKRKRRERSQQSIAKKRTEEFVETVVAGIPRLTFWQRVRRAIGL